MLKRIIPFAMVLITLVSCEQEIQKNVSEPTSGDALSVEIQELIGKYSEKRAASVDEIENFKNRQENADVVQRMSCSLDADAACSYESTAEFLYYVTNCVTFPLPSSGGYSLVNTRAAISYYVDGDGDVNCDDYEDNLQAMINNVIAQVGGSAWDIIPSVYYVSSCKERSGSNFIVFDLQVWVP